MHDEANRRPVASDAGARVVRLGSASNVDPRETAPRCSDDQLEPECDPGDAGSTGKQCPQGDTGPQGLGGLTYASTQNGDLYTDPVIGGGFESLTCPTGPKALEGGWHWLTRWASPSPASTQTRHRPADGAPNSQSGCRPARPVVGYAPSATPPPPLLACPPSPLSSACGQMPCSRVLPPTRR